MKNLSRLLGVILLFVILIGASVSYADPQAELSELRSKIDVIDKQLLELINQRAEVVFEIGELKRKNNMAVYDPTREKVIEEKLIKMNTGPMPNASVVKIFKTIIEASRTLQ